jgi:hypothetical protein
VKFVRANGDKPHRCPLCHSIPDRAWRDGRARAWALYQCSYCDVRWWRIWNDLTLRDHYWFARNRVTSWFEQRRL